MRTWNLAPARRQVSMNDGVWKLWREASGFWQCYTGVFSGDGRMIEGGWGGLSGGAAAEARC
jgi:hypothetical protein